MGTEAGSQLIGAGCVATMIKIQNYNLNSGFVPGSYGRQNLHVRFGQRSFVQDAARPLLPRFRVFTFQHILLVSSALSMFFLIKKNN